MRREFVGACEVNLALRLERFFDCTVALCITMNPTQRGFVMYIMSDRVMDPTDVLIICKEFVRAHLMRHNVRLLAMHARRL